MKPEGPLLKGKIRFWELMGSGEGKDF